MTKNSRSTPCDSRTLGAAADRAAKAIPPAWPLASSVAVNPFFGQADESLAQTGARLARVAGVSVTLPRSWHQERIASGAITDEDLAGALASAPPTPLLAGVGDLKAAAKRTRPKVEAVPTIADLAAQASGIDWPGFIAERFGAGAAGYFDEGQAHWAAPRGRSAYAAWRAVATHDLTPEIAGLQVFAAFVSEAPESAPDARARAVVRLGLAPDALDTYFHRSLMTLGGWAQVARHALWRAELAGGADDAITDFLTIRLLWEEALFERYADTITPKWEAARASHASPLAPSVDDEIDAVLQEAAERAAQRDLAKTLATPAKTAPEGRPSPQAAFCIDVRSEVFRRALEAVDPSVATLGFSGFFGLGASHRRFASDVKELRLPVLLNPGVMTCSGGPGDATRDQSARLKARASRAWRRFKLAAVSSFAFVEATGPIYAGTLFRDPLGLSHGPARVDPPPRFDPAVDPAARIKAAETVLRAMSSTTGFAKLVLLVGHGADVVNNPHASGLRCGACGGYSGEVNARLLTGPLNDSDVRAGLAEKGIEIPSDTLFIGALHDTTTDRVTLYADDHPHVSRRKGIDQAKVWLAAAGKAARAERALRLPRAGVADSVFRRSRAWSEIRPEWALVGCNAFIAAPRGRTAGKSLASRAFLHDYAWTRDKDFGVLELIMTAPVVVASWISLQYYGSTVAPQAFGGGDKLLHNVTGGIGVIEGNGGLLRAGLPWQSVHDGEKLIHDPLRLCVCIEAPREAMTDILRRHEGVRAPFDNRWSHLFALDEAGRMAWRYAGDLKWSPMADGQSAARTRRLEAAV